MKACFTIQQAPGSNLVQPGVCTFVVAMRPRMCARNVSTVHEVGAWLLMDKARRDLGIVSAAIRTQQA